MKKSTAITIAIITIIMLAAISTRAYFTSQAEISPLLLGSGTVGINMKLEDAPEADISGLMSGDKIWIPGDHREALLTIENTGSLPARWRLGVMPNGACDPELVDNIIFTWYRMDANGTWQLVRSDTLDKYLVDGSGGAWLLDSAAAAPGAFEPLAAGQTRQLLLQVDFELSALSPLQGREFKGRLLLQGAQLSQEEWFPAASLPLEVEEGGA